MRTILYTVFSFLLVNLLMHYFYVRIDLTQDKRFTLSETTKDILKKIDSVVYIDVLMKSNLPPEFERLRLQTEQLLEEFNDVTPKIQFNFVNPVTKNHGAKETLNFLRNLGITPTQVTEEHFGEITQKLLFPFSLVNYNQRTIKVKLYKHSLIYDTNTSINKSIEQLEYKLILAIASAIGIKKKNVAILKGNGALPDPNIADFLTTLKDSYKIAPFTLKTASDIPQKTLDSLLKFDLAIIAKPTIPFTDQQKYILDQYVMRGKKLMLLLENTNAELDSLYNNGQILAINNPLNLQDFLFRYGIRIDQKLVKDLQSTNIVLASGTGSQTQYNTIPLFYAPKSISKKNHPIVQNIEPIKFSFVNPIDTLPNSIRKTILLTSSKYSKKIGLPKLIEINRLIERPIISEYNFKNIPFAVLLEGNFTSVYNNRVKPLSLKENINKSPDNAMVVVSDGDIIKNQTQQGKTLELGYDKWTHTFFDNKTFLLNCVNYLLDDVGLIHIGSRTLTIPLIDKVELKKHFLSIQIFAVGMPLFFLLMLYSGFYLYRKKRYS